MKNNLREEVLSLHKDAQNILFRLAPSVDQIADHTDFDVSNRFRTQVKSKLFYLFGSDNPNVVKTIIGWWWGKTTSKTHLGYADRPLGQEVNGRSFLLSEFSSCLDYLFFLDYKKIWLRSAISHSNMRGRRFVQRGAPKKL